MHSEWMQRYLIFVNLLCVGFVDILMGVCLMRSAISFCALEVSQTFNKSQQIFPEIDRNQSNEPKNQNSLRIIRQTTPDFYVSIYAMT